MSRIAELLTVGDHLARCVTALFPALKLIEEDRRTRQCKVIVLAQNSVAILRQLADIKSADHLAFSSETSELGAIDTFRLVEDAAAVDDTVRALGKTSPPKRGMSNARDRFVL